MSNAGFVGFDGTENNRTILALQQVKKAAGIQGDLNVLLRRPHGRARSVVAKFNRMFGVKALVSDKADKEKWEKAGVKIEGGYIDFFEASDFVMVRTPHDEELPYCEAKSEYCVIMPSRSGKDRPEILKGSEESRKVRTSCDMRVNFFREFFYCLESYEASLKLKDLQPSKEARVDDKWS